jgi:short-subunit dehydrogenase
MSRLPPYQFCDGLAMVTGAASGIGEQFAKQLAIRGSNLHLVDRDETRLAAVADRIAWDNPAARIAIFDLEAIEKLSEFAEDLIKNGSPPFWWTTPALLSAASSDN